MSSDDARLTKYQRYNRTGKGRARNDRYERKHPERRVRWLRITGRDVAAGNIAAMAPEPPAAELP